MLPIKVFPNKTNRGRAKVVITILSIVLLCLTSSVYSVSAGGPATTTRYSVTYNPYANVVWGSWQALKTELHCHTTQSDGGSLPSTVINQYSAAGFNVLAISDHNTVSWPWTNWGIDPATTGMVAIPNDEVSNPAWHILAPFGLQPLNGYNYATPQDTIDPIIGEGAIPIICHPEKMGYTITTLDSWRGFQGIEIYNPSEGQKLQDLDFQLWDHLLSDSSRLAQQPIQNRIWGFADDDSHDTPMVNKAWITVYAPSKDFTSIRRSLIAGSFLANVGLPATIGSITVDNPNGQITVNTNLTVSWKANGLQVVGAGNTLSLLDLPLGLTYVRAEISASGGYVFTQPFFIQQGTQQPTQCSLSVGTAGSGTTDITGTSYYPAGSVVSVQANPADGWMLDNWLINGSKVGPANPCIFVLNADLNLTAAFVNYGGDANNDGIVNSLDIGKVNAHWSPLGGAPSWSLGYDVSVDCNGDGYIDSLDVGIINAHWRQAIP